MRSDIEPLEEHLPQAPVPLLCQGDGTVVETDVDPPSHLCLTRVRGQLKFELKEVFHGLQPLLIPGGNGEFTPTGQAQGVAWQPGLGPRDLPQHLRFIDPVEILRQPHQDTLIAPPKEVHIGLGDHGADGERSVLDNVGQQFTLVNEAAG